MKIGTDEMYVRLTDAPREYPTLEYSVLYRGARDGKIRHQRRGAAWWLWRPDLELMVIKHSAVKNGIVTPSTFDAMQSATEALGETVGAICTAKINMTIGLRSLTADERDARGRGDVELADAILEVIALLQTSTAHWNGSRWVLLDQQGNQLAESRPAPTSGVSA